ncbi:MAG: diguanylate cyclase [Alphaproteobacteria bacterium]|nr:diguanylate cyclase [Alphaproteobacteria bacterium]
MKKKQPSALKGYVRKAPDNAESYTSAVVDELRAEITLLTSYSNDVIYRLRYDTMQYDYISPSVVRLLGFSQDEMKKLSIRSLILETRLVSNALRTIDSFSKFEEDRKRGEVSKWQADYLMRTKDGRKIWVADISYPWFDESGNIVGSVGSLRDISERVAAETQAKEDIARMASTDQLTGLSSRSVFFDRLEEELRRIKRNRDDLSILLIDIDHFRNINNNYGQQAGDKVLVGVAKIISSCLRETDTGARIGGEEFAVILPETPANGAFWVGERIRSSIAKQMFHLNEQNPMVGCTVSVGIASARFDQNLDSETLYKTADKRLFIAKHTGRNQVSMDEIVEMH